MSSNVTITKGTTSVTVHTVTVKENFIRAIDQYNRLRTKSTYSAGYTKYFFDFLKITRNIEVTGYITTESGISVTTLRDSLKTIFNAGGEVSVTYLGETITGAMLGLEFREIPADDNTPRFFLVTFNIMEGSLR